MKRLAMVIFMVCLLASSAFAQNEAGSDAQSQQEAPAVMPQPDEVTQPQEISIYGEVKAAGQKPNIITVQYYDYDSDEEKTIDITVDSNTKMDNAALVSDIKQGNWVDVIYAVGGGVNLAKSVIVEKEDEMPAVEMPAAESTPKDEALLNQ